MVSARWPFPAFFSPTIRAALSADAVLVRLVRARWLYGVEPFFVLSPIGRWRHGDWPRGSFTPPRGIAAVDTEA
ncbi:MAG: hypothetical protein DME40_09630 [Verrucomicrobia bacterium]|nr:MAG: hypothetical protein DME37_12325 [Verrucomicrobiota bacterium]PYK89847.1 MAG: hypothetical protein DME40_09630 [Verrucomicrobiota bacterium]PYM05826.1 MAG: hypothetical protein DMF15_14705 [Verrucomicrobiota bacterium]